MKTKLGFLLLGLGLVFSMSCTKYPPDSDRLLEELAVVTQYDTKDTLSNYDTYAMSDTIIRISGDDGKVKEYLTGGTAKAILDQINKNMAARGYRKATGSEKPDLGIQVTYFQNTTVTAYYYDYWGWYGYYYPYYPYYPVYYSSYTTGLANIEMLNLTKSDPIANRTPISWNAFIRGLLTGNHSDGEITRAVDQAFKQTPQIQSTP